MWQKERSGFCHIGNWLCDGGFYAQSYFKTAIAKPVLYDVVFSKSNGKT